MKLFKIYDTYINPQQIVNVSSINGETVITLISPISYKHNGMFIKTDKIVTDTPYDSIIDQINQCL